MAKVEILEILFEQITKKFKSESEKIFLQLKSFEENPRKGKLLGEVGGILIKEFKYKNFRFYFLVDGYKLKFLTEKELTEILLRFVRMSDKKHQQKTIDEIKNVLKIIGPRGF